MYRHKISDDLLTSDVKASYEGDTMMLDVKMALIDPVKEWFRANRMDIPRLNVNIIGNDESEVWIEFPTLESKIAFTVTWC